MRVCLYVPCGHLLGKGWPLGSRLWCQLWVCHFPIGILGQVWYLIVSIPDLCTLTYFDILIEFLREHYVNVNLETISQPTTTEAWKISSMHMVKINSSFIYYQVSSLSVFTMSPITSLSIIWRLCHGAWELFLLPLHARIQKLLPQAVQHWQFFSWWGEVGSKYHYKRAIIDSPAKSNLNGVSLACRCWPNIENWLGSSVIFRGSGPALLRNPIFCDFTEGGGSGPCPPSGFAHALILVNMPNVADASIFYL